MRLIAAQFRRLPSGLLIVLLWVLLTIPGIFIRGAHYEEGTTAGLARGAFQDGHWISPYLYGVRSVERPALVSWLLAAAGLITHRLDLWVVRLPATISILCGALLLRNFVRRHSSVAAAKFAAICFLVSPMVLQKIVTAEPDTIVSFLLFGALVMWWNGFENGNTTFLRWVAIGCVLSAAALVKGPQPLGYFFLGIGAYLLARRKVAELMKLGLAAILPLTVSAAWYLAVYQPGDLQVWLAHARIRILGSSGHYLWHVVRLCLLIALESLPGVLLSAMLAIARLRRRSIETGELAVLLLYYASVCTSVLIFWPGANGRYAMPAIFAIAAAGGLGFETFRMMRPLLVRSSVLIASALAIYGIALNCIAMPIYPDLFRQNTLLAQRIETITAEQPWPIYVMPNSASRDLLLYLRSSVRIVSLQSMSVLEPPFWAIMSATEEQFFTAERRDVTTSTRMELSSGKVLVQVTKK